MTHAPQMGSSKLTLLHDKAQRDSLSTLASKQHLPCLTGGSTKFPFSVTIAGKTEDLVL